MWNCVDDKIDNEEGRAPLEYLPRGPLVSSYATDSVLCPRVGWLKSPSLSLVFKICLKLTKKLRLLRCPQTPTGASPLDPTGNFRPQATWLCTPLTSLYDKHHPADALHDV